jgi:hypothetical protein
MAPIPIDGTVTLKAKAYLSSWSLELDAFSRVHINLTNTVEPVSFSPREGSTPRRRR